MWARSNVRGIEGTPGGQQNHFEPWLTFRLYSLCLIETENESVPQIEGLEKKEIRESEIVQKLWKKTKYVFFHYID